MHDIGFLPGGSGSMAGGSLTTNRRYYFSHKECNDEYTDFRNKKTDPASVGGSRFGSVFVGII